MAFGSYELQTKPKVKLLGRIGGIAMPAAPLPSSLPASHRVSRVPKPTSPDPSPDQRAAAVQSLGRALLQRKKEAEEAQAAGILQRAASKLDSAGSRRQSRETRRQSREQESQRGKSTPSVRPPADNALDGADGRKPRPPRASECPPRPASARLKRDTKVATPRPEWDETPLRPRPPSLRGMFLHDKRFEQWTEPFAKGIHPGLERSRHRSPPPTATCSPWNGFVLVAAGR